MRTREMRKGTRGERPNKFEEIEDVREDEREGERDEDRSELGSNDSRNCDKNNYDAADMITKSVQLPKCLKSTL